MTKTQGCICLLFIFIYICIYVNGYIKREKVKVVERSSLDDLLNRIHQGFSFVFATAELREHDSQAKSVSSCKKKEETTHGKRL